MPTAIRLRSGYTLMELVVSMGSAAMLMVGMASALFISVSVFQGDGGSQAGKGTAAEIQADLMTDLQHALSFSERTPNSVTFNVPDRTGDAVPETIRYAWSGTPGDPLTYSYNGGTAVTLADDVQQFDLSYLMRDGWYGPVYRGFTEKKVVLSAQSISIGKPSDTVAGDLLIAAVSVENDNELLMTAPSGWNVLYIQDYNDAVSFGVWWKIAGASEPASYTFSWPGGSFEESYGWMMRFTDHDPANPIHAWSWARGTNTYSPLSPAVTTTVDNTLILRLGGFDHNAVTVDSTGLTDHIDITMDHAFFVSGGGGYAYQQPAGSSGNSAFAITGIQEYVTITIAIAPAP